MSTQIAQIGELNLNQFFGGKKRGLCLQFTPPYGVHYAQLTNEQVRELVNHLQHWLAECELEMGPRDAIPQRLIDQARKALVGDSNDAEHDALFALVKAIEENCR